ncbi:MAG: mannosyltransferase family protein [Candidatus Gottesmanbacteria bacterium]
MRFVIISFIIWRLLLTLITLISINILPLRTGFLGGGLEKYAPNPLLWGWANMDGVHYLSIAQNGYFQFEQAFFPLYPLLIRLISKISSLDNIISGLMISHISTLLGIIIFYKFIEKQFSANLAKQAIVIFLIFPGSFFLVSVYTEGLFFFLIIASIYFTNQKKWFLASIFAGLASATRLAGIFLLPVMLYIWLKDNKKSWQQIPIILLSSSGLLFYLYYLWKIYNDPLLFFHVQPAFGANRSGESIIILPQVLFRYIKIFVTASFSYDYLIAGLEFGFFLSAIILLIRCIHKIPISYQIFAWLSLLVPTLTGSLSSMPRYLLTIFPLFICLALEKKPVKISYIAISAIILVFTMMFFFRGYFIS